MKVFILLCVCSLSCFLFISCANDNDIPTDEKYIYFGSYPQTEVSDIELKGSLDTLAGELPTSSNSQLWTSYGYYMSGSVSNYMWYIDIDAGTERYRGVYFTDYRPYYTDSDSSASNTDQDDNGYTTGSVYWFKYEPIKWRILKEENGNALLLSDMQIDSREYDESSNNYANSNIRTWLNDDFYNVAFSDLEKGEIQLITVDNSDVSSGYLFNRYACENTDDNIFLISYAEAINPSYGFASSDDYDTLRQKKTTDYAQCQGAYTSVSDNYAANGWWWMRSPNDYGHNSSGSAGVVSYSGYAYYGSNVSRTDRGVCPALWISLE